MRVQVVRVSLSWYERYFTGTDVFRHWSKLKSKYAWQTNNNAIIEWLETLGFA